MTNYTIFYELAHRVNKLTIPAHSPMEAFKKFKEMMPQIVYNNLSVKTVEVNIPKDCVKKSEPKTCLPCAPAFDKLLKTIPAKIEGFVDKGNYKRPPAEYSNPRHYDLV